MYAVAIAINTILHVCPVLGAVKVDKIIPFHKITFNILSKLYLDQK